MLEVLMLTDINNLYKNIYLKQFKDISTNYYIVMTTAQRNRFPWTINECLRLQREFELLQLPIVEIAAKHKRTPRAIMFKLQQDGLSTYNELYDKVYPDGMECLPIYPYTKSDNSCASVTSEDTKMNELKQRLVTLEKQVTQLTNALSSSNKRTYSEFRSAHL
jgi:hypothetical protein